jgi:mono/diheme cytochrome c family protein
MRKPAAIAVALLALGASAGPSQSADPQDFAAVERGRYLANAADCASCHTIPGDAHPFSGGRPIDTPFGVLAAPNITPDRETGIGSWTDDQFDAAVRQGRRRNGARLYPAMPFPYYTRMSREDVNDIRAYLDTIEPVRNAVQVNRLPFPLNLRASMIVWDALYFKPGEFYEDPSKSKEWNRGAYLAQGPAHCGACHTPKTFLGGRASRRRVARMDGTRHYERTGRAP